MPLPMFEFLLGGPDFKWILSSSLSLVMSGRLSMFDLASDETNSFTMFFCRPSTLAAMTEPSTGMRSLKPLLQSPLIEYKILLISSNSVIIFWLLWSLASKPLIIADSSFSIWAFET